MATAAEVEEAEARLGLQLPPSYRQAILSAEPVLPGGHGMRLLSLTEIDERVILLNPARTDRSGEWEAWDFATWYPGAYRYPSYQRLVEAIAAE
jgi:hypothetical protein